MGVMYSGSRFMPISFMVATIVKYREQVENHAVIFYNTLRFFFPSPFFLSSPE